MSDRPKSIIFLSKMPIERISNMHTFRIWNFYWWSPSFNLDHLPYFDGHKSQLVDVLSMHKKWRQSNPQNLTWTYQNVSNSKKRRGGMGLLPKYFWKFSKLLTDPLHPCIQTYHYHVKISKIVNSSLIEL